MNKNKKGSALLCVILVMNILVPALSMLVVISGFIFEQYKDHIFYTQKKCLSQALLNYAISFCCHHFNDFKRELDINDEVGAEGLIFEIEQWPSGNNKNENYRGTIIIKRYGSSLLINSLLYINNLNAFCTSCVLSNNKQQQYIIENWQSSTKKS